MIHRRAITFLFALLCAQLGVSQVDVESSLYQSLYSLDQELFDRGFNQCILDKYDQIIAEDLEFYHDQSGITHGRQAFIQTVEENICSNPDRKPIRKLKAGSLQVFPLYENGELYGAIQIGSHDFFIREPNKELYQTSTAAFNHLWLKINGSWKLKRVLSYNHQ